MGAGSRTGNFPDNLDFLQKSPKYNVQSYKRALNVRIGRLSPYIVTMMKHGRNERIDEGGENVSSASTVVFIHPLFYLH